MKINLESLLKSFPQLFKKELVLFYVTLKYAADSVFNIIHSALIGYLYTLSSKSESQLPCFIVCIFLDMKASSIWTAMFKYSHRICIFTNYSTLFSSEINWPSSNFGIGIFSTLQQTLYQFNTCGENHCHLLNNLFQCQNWASRKCY